MHPNAWRAGKEKIEVSAILREVRPASLKIADGTTKEVVDKHTGEITEKEVERFLPKSQVEIEGYEMEEADMLIGKALVFLVPRWLAEEKGLV